MDTQQQSTSHISLNQFTKGLNTDTDLTMLSPDSWTFARNAVNNSHDGKIGDIGNEPANLFCTQAPYSVIGTIYVVDNQWVIFSTNDIDSEIGLFNETTCTYNKIINDKCLSFNRTYLITGAAKKNFDCTYSIYWDDGLNPSRQLNINRPVYKLLSVSNDQCHTEIFSTEVDCEKLRLSRITKVPTIKLTKATSGGELPNGSYQIAIAYTVNQVRVTDYFTPSNIQSLFHHSNLHGALDVKLNNLDTNYDEFELVVISFINQKPNCVKLGNYSTRQNTIFIDFLNPTLPIIPIEYIPLQTPTYEKSDAMYEVNDYLLRVGIYSKPDFNYQPIANNIIAKWVAVQVPGDYYSKGGNLTSYMKDEQYAFFIRWIYNTGQKSASYHIPGRKSTIEDTKIVTGKDVYELLDPTADLPENWQVYNTAIKTSSTIYNIPEGVVIAEGDMGYWESTELYPTNAKTVWGDNCGLNIRHHKFPNNTLVPNSNNNGESINILGVKFENIKHPLDFLGNPITSVIGYEILRGTREGNKTIIAKGLLNNVGEYDIPNGISTKKGLYQNYPYNDLHIDPFLSKKLVKGGCVGVDYEPMGEYRDDIFTFHSPDTQFKNPFLSAYELRVESLDSGDVIGNFEPVYKHPKSKLIRDVALVAAGVGGIAVGLEALHGKRTTSIESARSFNAGITGVSGWTITGNPSGGGTGTITSVGNGGIRPVSEATPYAADGTLIAPGFGGIGSASSTTITKGGMGNIVLDKVSNIFLCSYFVGKGAEEILRIIKAMLPFTQHAYQYNSHGFYNTHNSVSIGNLRRQILDSNYLESHLQEFGTNYRINNLYRGRTVILQLQDTLDRPSIIDNTRQTIGQKGLYYNPTQEFKTTTSAYYVSLKNPLQAQYGQIDSINQISVTQGVIYTNPVTTGYASPVIFGGDVYINRYTEKNTMFFFNDWAFDLPDGYPKDYRLNTNIPYPTYWINSEEFDLSRLTNAFTETALSILVGGEVGYDVGLALGNSNVGEIVGEAVGGLAGGIISAANLSGVDVLPNDYMYLDRDSATCGVSFSTLSNFSFGVTHGYFYLFNSGIRDFFVESEINIAQRDHDDTIASRHYDHATYTDKTALFRSDIIKAGNNFKYDYSLSCSRLLYNYISWGQVLSRDYDPTIAEQCYSYYPNRVIYSLPQSEENKKDNWIAFLANNYKDFTSKVRSIKNVHKSGAIIYFDTDSPVTFQGVDSLQTQGGIKVTIGDGGLFNQPLQSMTNTDVFYQYGSCQDKFSIIGTPYGLFWASQNQGKIFQYVGGELRDITKFSNKWHFANYLPSFLLKRFPEYGNTDNTVNGIGIQAGYDNTNEIVYFTKKDYLPLKDCLKYDPTVKKFYCPSTTTINIPGTITTTCPPGYTLVDNTCTKIETIASIPDTNTVYTTRTPYYVYGTGGAFLYRLPLITPPTSIPSPTPGIGSTTVPLTNPFWINPPLLPGSTNNTQVDQLDLGSVNRCAIWGKYLDSNGKPYNNYNTPTTSTCVHPDGTQDNSLCPVKTWQGFTQCVHVDEDMTVFVGLAADNVYKFFVDDMTIPVISSTNIDSNGDPLHTGVTSDFNFLHIFPIVLTQGTHKIKMQGWNDASNACFAAEIYAFNTVSGLGAHPTVDQVYTYLNDTTKFNILSDLYGKDKSKINLIFTTREVDHFDAISYSCPSTGEWSQIGDGSCSPPVCTRTLTTAPTVITTPSTTQSVEVKNYVELTDPEYFQEISWTISYDPKSNIWISFHDWHPSFILSTKNHLITLQNNKLWKHNNRCDLFCNYYEKDYPFEIEIPTSTGQDITTLRSYEYMLEAYTYSNNCRDNFHVLDANFDKAIVSNSEQCSGALNMTIKPKNNPWVLNTYPRINSNSVDILFSKEENKYRFNAFFDLVKDRGEFTGIQTPIWYIQPNGYIRDLNQKALNYGKDALQHKKFRHYSNKLCLRKNVSGNIKFLMKLTNSKQLRSPR